MAEISAPVFLLALPTVVPSEGAYAPYSGPRLLAVSTLPTAFRSDGNGGTGTIYGTVDRKGTPANVPLRRKVRLHRDVDGLMVQETWSNATTGAFSFTGLDLSYKYTTIAYDYEHNFRAEAADNLTPEVPA